MDYSKNLFTTSQVADACDVKAGTLRMYFARKQFHKMGRNEPGMPDYFSLRDTMHFALAARLIKVAGLPPKEAYDAAVVWAFVGTEGPIEGEIVDAFTPYDSQNFKMERHAGATFDEREHGLTVFVYWPEKGQGRVFKEDEILGLHSLRLRATAEQAAILIILNDVERQVLRALGIDPRK